MHGLMLHVPCRRSVCDDGWFNLCSPIAQCATGVQPHQSQRPIRLGQVRPLTAAIIHTHSTLVLLVWDSAMRSHAPTTQLKTLVWQWYDNRLVSSSVGPEPVQNIQCLDKENGQNMPATSPVQQQSAMLPRGVLYVRLRRMASLRSVPKTSKGWRCCTLVWNSCLWLHKMPPIYYL